MEDILKNKIEYIKGVGPAKAEIIQKELNYYTWEDILHHFPIRYIDKTKFFSINELKPEMHSALIKGIVTNVKESGTGNAKRFTAIFKDETGTMELVWFKGVDWIKKLIIPLTILLLIAFCIHLGIQGKEFGFTNGNCGCFGSLLPMTPIEAIIKNVVAMALLVWLFIILPKTIEKGHNFWVLATVTLASILALFMVAPIQPVVAETLEPETNSVLPVIDTTMTSVPAIETIKDTTSIKTDATKKVEKEVEKVIDEPAKKKSGFAQYFSTIDNGRKTLALFVPGCDHCRDAAKELTELRKKTKNFPEISIIFMNEEAELIPDFFKAAGAEYPYKIIEVIPFWKVLGTGRDTPGIKYLWNGNEYKYYDGINANKFDVHDFEKLIAKPYSELKK